MKTQIHIYLPIMILSSILLAGCSGAGQTQTAASEPTAAAETIPVSEKTGKLTFEAKDIEGNTISSDIFSNSKLTMINVWATYCNPCLSEMPELGEIAKEYDSSEFQIIGIISDVLANADEDTITYAKNLIEKTGADYPHLLVNVPLIYALLQDVAVVPTTFFIDQNGSIIDTAIGSMDKSSWEEKINELLEEL